MSAIRIKTLHFLAAFSGLLLLCLAFAGMFAPDFLSSGALGKFGLEIEQVNRFYFLGIFICIAFIYLIPHWMIALSLPLFTGLLLIQNIESGFFRSLFLFSNVFLLHPYFYLSGGYKAIQKLSYLAMGLVAVFFLSRLDFVGADLYVVQTVVLNLCIVAVLGVVLSITIGTNLAALTLGFSMVASASLALAMHPYIFAIFTVFYLWSIALPAMQERLAVASR